MGQSLIGQATVSVQDVFTATGAGSWMVPAGVSVVEALLVGGGGGLTLRAAAVSVGGSSGGMAIRRRIRVKAGDIMPLYVGAGGASSAGTTVAVGAVFQGGTGESTTFGGYTALGGQGTPSGYLDRGANSVGPGSGAGGTNGSNGGDGLDGYGGGGGSYSNGNPPVIGMGGRGASAGFILNQGAPSGAPNSGAGAPGYYTTTNVAWTLLAGAGMGGSGILILTYDRPV